MFLENSCRKNSIVWADDTGTLVGEDVKSQDRRTEEMCFLSDCEASDRTRRYTCQLFEGNSPVIEVTTSRLYINKDKIKDPPQMYSY
ncbi:hypothetical protein AMECASPLE_021324 [Ameca splendens]|uniref:Uncharacterized protein n=1 Tax=Ameca splendens TaxID=208324 RepID=A0ABV1A0C4_9TELE